MKYDDFKAKVFAEHPDVKAHYDALAPEYKAIRAKIERDKAHEASDAIRSKENDEEGSAEQSTN